MYQSLDGEFESVQPSLKVPVSYFTRWDGFDDNDEEMLQQQYGQEVDTFTTLTEPSSWSMCQTIISTWHYF